MRQKIENGILYINNKPAIALGVTYWGSYHPLKIPVPDMTKRFDEMQIDIEGISKAGFNIIRTAALGTIKKQCNSVSLDYSFTDQLIEKAEKEGLACLVRLQGYEMNLSNYDDTIMLNHNNEKMPLYASFIMNCVNHQGVIDDNEEGTLALAKHFSEFDNVVGHQIYNEPAYPQHVGVYCYNPESIKRYKKWLVEKGIKTREAAEDTVVPRKRPDKGEDTGEWINWRIFSLERLNEFLCDVGKAAKQGNINSEIFTCHIVRPFLPYNACRGEDYYITANGMDFLGITHYIEAKGATFQTASMALDGAESASAVFGKHTWLIECNAKVDLSVSEWERETYNALGSGIKGIIYYQWRADYPFKDGPESNTYGMLYNNREKTAKFDGSIKMNKMLNKLSPFIASANKIRSGVGILYSNHGFAYYDAVDNPSDLNIKPDFSQFNMVSPIPPEWNDRYAYYMQKIYTAFKKLRVCPDFIRAEDLESNSLGIKLLVIPSLKSISPAERDMINCFLSNGGMVYTYEDWSGWYEKYNGDGKKSKQRIMYDAAGILEKSSIEIPVTCSGNANYLDVKLLKSTDKECPYTVLVLINYHPDEKSTQENDVEIKLNNIEMTDKTALFISTGKTEIIKIANNTMKIPAVDTGAFIFIAKNEHIKEII